MDSRRDQKKQNSEISSPEDILRGVDGSLLSWFHENPDQTEEYIDYLDIWNASAIKKKSGNYNKSRAWEKVKKQIASKGEERIIRKKRRLLYFSFAASFALIIAIITYQVMSRTVQQEIAGFQEMDVPYGSRSEITLPDGTHVWLNAGSKIRYSNAYNIKNREIWMEGECYFKVVPDNDLKFIVEAPGVRVIAVGTEFNIKAYSDEKIIEATLVNGIIEVQPSTREKNSKEKIILTGRQTALLQKIDSSLDPDKKIEDSQSRFQASPYEEEITDFKEIKYNPTPELQTSWKEGKLIVQQEKLSSLARKLERRYNVTIEFTDTSSQNYIFSGILMNETLEQVLNIIRLTSPVKYSVSGNIITIQEDKQLRKLLD